MADLQAALATQMRNIETRTGKTFAQLCKVIADSGLTKVGKQRSMLMEKFGLGYGDANTLPPGGMCQYSVRLSGPAGINAELMGWVRAAYDAAG